MAITNAATPPTTPPMIAFVFELPPPEDGVVLFVGLVEEEEVEAPIIAPGPISGLSTK